MPVCWNWQTRRTQNPLSARTCGFDPRHRHQAEPGRVFAFQVQFFSFALTLALIADIYFFNITHAGAKSALLRRLFMLAAKKDVIHPLPCASFPNRNPAPAVAVWFPKCARISFLSTFLTSERVALVLIFYSIKNQ